MGFFLKACSKCGHTFSQEGFFRTTSPFHPEGVLNLCRDCVQELLRQHPDDLGFADKLCQWADLPFNPTDWIKFYEVNKDNTFNVYYNVYSADERMDITWTDFNEKWVQAQQKGQLEDEIDFFSAEKEKQLSKKWGVNYDAEELNYLEQLLNGMMQTQNINGKLQMDQAIKLCKISLIIDQKIRAEENFKDELVNYDKLVKIADFTPKNVKNANDFDSAGEIFAYLEKTGWNNKYYDGATMDVVDKTMKNIQAWIRHLYVNETNIPEDIERKIQALKTAKELEDQMEDVDETSLDRVDSDAYDFEGEEFDAELV